MPEYTMEDLINESLYGMKPKKKKQPKKIQESETDVKKILHEADDEKETEEGDKDASTPDPSDASAGSSQEKALNKEPDGDLVMTITLTISGSDQGKQQIGEDEYASITNINSLLSLYDIDTKNIVDPEKTTETLELTVQEEVSSSDKNNISMMMRSNIDGTISINVLVNELGQTFDNLDSAIQYFNQQYQNNILNIINKETRG